MAYLFNKKTWVTDETITEEELNRMEDGIAEANKVIVLKYGEEIDADFASRLINLFSQNKVNLLSFVQANDQPQRSDILSSAVAILTVDGQSVVGFQSTAWNVVSGVNIIEVYTWELKPDGAWIMQDVNVVAVRDEIVYVDMRNDPKSFNELKRDLLSRKVVKYIEDELVEVGYRYSEYTLAALDYGDNGYYALFNGCGLVGSSAEPITLMFFASNPDDPMTEA